jgi:hypothetical protein
MDTPRRATGYDLFKLIVAIILLILFFLLNWRATPQSPASISMPNAKPTTVPSSSTSISLTSTSVLMLAPNATNVPASTQTPRASPTATNLSAPTATLLPSPATTAASSTATPGAETPAISACDTASSRSRLQPGMSVIILRRLNFRSSPGIGNNWLRTNIPGTRVEVVSGPACIPHSIGAYIWWQIKLPDGQMGWSAEASQHGTFYFMEQTK